MVFMGEEWAARQPFLFFSDVGDDLADKIREVRQKELSEFPAGEGRGDPPDPMSEDTFRASKLDWDDREHGEHQAFLSLYRQLIDLRKKQIIPRLHGMGGHIGHYELLGEKVVSVRWTLGDGSHLSLIANFSADPARGISVPDKDVLWVEGSVAGGVLGGWTALFTLNANS